ncbi:hypothetical protein GCM10010377_68930 [Streptomyces viridiviolaceus]|nr:hypothetical protein GCM10010377_68930 [Streptomyces viridiviolaceus]
MDAQQRCPLIHLRRSVRSPEPPVGRGFERIDEVAAIGSRVAGNVLRGVRSPMRTDDWNSPATCRSRSGTP